MEKNASKKAKFASKSGNASKSGKAGGKLALAAGGKPAGAKRQGFAEKRGFTAPAGATGKGGGSGAKGKGGGGGGKPRRPAAAGAAGAAAGGKPRPGKKITKEDAERLREQRRAAHPHAETVAQLVALYNELRERKTPSARRIELVGAALKLLRGKLDGLLLRHDASRVVEGCIKFGAPAQKSELAAALAGKALALAKDKHGHFIVEKLLRYGPPPAREAVRRELRGHVARLLTHNLGALVLEAGFKWAWNAGQAWELYQEAFGPEYVSFKAGAEVAGRNLRALLAAAPGKRKSVLEALFYTLTKQADKGLLSLSVSQRLLGDYASAAPPEQLVALIPLLKDHLLSLLATREGAGVAAACFAYGTPKERKLLLRALKGHMLDVACHDHGHMVVCVALAVTDDTRTSGSAVFDELGPHLPYLACHRFGRKVLLGLLTPRSPRYFTAQDLAMLAPVTLPAYLVGRKEKAAPAAPAAAGAGAAAAAGDEGEAPPPAAAAPVQHVLAAPPSAEVAGDAAAMAPTPTSKKGEDARRGELLATIRPQLESALATHTSVLARSHYGAAVLAEAAIVLSVGLPPALPPSAAALSAVAELAADEPSPEELAAQIDEMNAAARAASYEAQARTSKAERAAVTAQANEAVSAAAPAAAAAAAEGAQPPAAKKAKLAAAAEGEKEEEGGDAEEAEDGDEEEGEGDEFDEADEEEDAEDDAIGDSDLDDDGVAGLIPSSAGDAAGAPAAERLPLFEDPEAHLVFKRLLKREAQPREGDKRPQPDAADAPSAAAPVFGPLLWGQLRGRLASLATSNRACFVLAELAASRDAAVAKAVLGELAKDAETLRAQPQSAGRDLLLQKVAGAAGSSGGDKGSAAAAQLQSKKKGVATGAGKGAAAAAPEPSGNRSSAQAAVASSGPAAGSRKRKA